MRLELPWHDWPQYLSPGDYLHASRNDIYGISAAVFKNCYVEAPASEIIS